MLLILSLFILTLPMLLATTCSAIPMTASASLYLSLFLVFLALWTWIKGLSLKKLRPLKYPLVLTALLLIIAMAFSMGRIEGLDEILRYALCLMLFLIIAPLSENEKKQVFSSIVLGALIISALAIHQYFFGFTILQNYVVKAGITDPYALEKIVQRRVFFPFPLPGILGGYLAMTLPLVFSSKRTRFLSILLLFALLMTKSLGALLSLMIVIAVLLFLRTHASKKKIFALLALGAIFLCVFILRENNPEHHLQPLYSMMERNNYWKQTWDLIRTHPLTGIGFGNFDLPRSRYAHNFFLQLWAEAGALGLISFFWLLTAILKNGWKRLQEPSERPRALGLIAGIFIFLIHNLTDFTFFLPATSLIWWAMLGLLYVPPENLSHPPPANITSLEKKACALL